MPAPIISMLLLRGLTLGMSKLEECVICLSVRYFDRELIFCITKPYLFLSKPYLSISNPFFLYAYPSSRSRSLVVGMEGTVWGQGSVDPSCHSVIFQILVSVSVEHAIA